MLGCNSQRWPRAGPLILRYYAYSTKNKTINGKLVFTALMATFCKSKNACKLASRTPPPGRKLVVCPVYNLTEEAPSLCPRAGRQAELPLNGVSSRLLRCQASFCGG